MFDMDHDDLDTSGKVARVTLKFEGRSASPRNRTRRRLCMV